MSTPPHIGLIAQGGVGWAGGTEYIRNLLHAVSAADPCASVSLLCHSAQAQEWKSLIDPKHRVVPVPARRPKSLLNRFRSSNSHFTNAAREARIDFLYPFTYDNEYNVGVTLPLGESLAPAGWAGWIPDFQHRHLPQLFSEKEIARREHGIELLARDAPIIVFSSQSAAADARRFVPAASDKARVLTFATFPEPAWYEDAAREVLSWLPERFFVVSNQFWKHKNHLVIFEALELLLRRGIAPKVVCTGRVADFRDPDYTDVILQKLHRMGIASQVLLLGVVERSLQIQIMRRSLAVLQPSLFEGWSTVVEDARVLGKPIILSDIPVHREQNPPGARFFPPESAPALAAILEEWWASLVPGPNRASEAAARLTANDRIAEVGRSFLDLRTTAASRR